MIACHHHTIIRAAFVCLSICLSVCLFVCSCTPPRSFDGSSPNLLGVCRWTSELPLRGSFLKRSTGQRVKRHFFGADDTRLRPHRCKRWARHLLPSKRHTASKSLIPSTGIFTSCYNRSCFFSRYFFFYSVATIYMGFLKWLYDLFNPDPLPSSIQVVKTL